MDFNYQRILITLTTMKITLKCSNNLFYSKQCFSKNYSIIILRNTNLTINTSLAPEPDRARLTCYNLY